MPSPQFWSQLKNIIRENNPRRAYSNRVASYETQARRAEIIHQGFRILWKLGCRLPSPRGFRERHMHKLGRYWEAQGYKDIQTRFSAFRTFGNDWLNRPGMIKASEVYVENPESVKRHYVSNVDRTWTGNGVDVVAKIEEVANHDYRAGVILELCLTLGLRLAEALKLRPRESTMGTQLQVVYGTKNGRPRVVPIEAGAVGHLQRVVLQKAQAIVGSVHESMIPRTESYVKYRTHIYYLCRKFGITRNMLGVTAHGLRHEYAVAYFERHTGSQAPVRKPEADNSGELHQAVRRSLSKNLGHSRVSIVSCYLGSPRNRGE